MTKVIEAIERIEKGTPDMCDQARQLLWEAKRVEWEKELKLLRERVVQLIAERDQMTARIRNLIAEQRWKLRRDITDELGGEDPEAALMKIREMKARIAELETRA